MAILGEKFNGKPNIKIKIMVKLSQSPDFLLLKSIFMKFWMVCQKTKSNQQTFGIS